MSLLSLGKFLNKRRKTISMPVNKRFYCNPKGKILKCTVSKRRSLFILLQLQNTITFVKYVIHIFQHMVLAVIFFVPSTPTLANIHILLILAKNISLHPLCVKSIYLFLKRHLPVCVYQDIHTDIKCSLCYLQYTKKRKQGISRIS